MTLRFIFTLLLLTLTCATLYGAQSNSTTDPQSGVARDLARFRAAHYSNLRYRLDVSVYPDAPMMQGSEEIHVALDAAVDQLVLDWRVAAVKEGQPVARAWEIEVNGHQVKDAREVNDHILIPGKYLLKGENIVQLKFESPISTSGSAVTRYLDREDKSEYIYTLFVPSDASTAFPCFDQPDLKARFQLDVSTRTDWTVISNTYQTTVTRNGTNSFWHFAETEPISTYLFAFAAGPFAQFPELHSLSNHNETADPILKSVEGINQSAQNTAPPLRLFVRKSQVEKARKEWPEVFRLHRDCLAFLADYFDFKFPFPKYDIVLVPEFAYGGMEHAGATFLREDRILFPTDPTANDLAARAEVICHEASHQWFGDLVTMRWFDDLWLKEGFATFMAYKAMEKILPQYNAWKIFYQRTKPGAYSTDATKGTTPIFQEIPNLSAAKSAYGNIVYLKAPSMLRQAEFFLGADKFQQAIRAFLKEHAFSNAEWADLVKAFERSSGSNLEAWAAAWVKRRGFANVSVDWSENRAGRITRLVLTQTDVLNEGGTWPMRLKLFLAHNGSSPEIFTVTLKGAGMTRVNQAIGKRSPSFIFANYEDYGYGRFLLDKKSMVDVVHKGDLVWDEKTNRVIMVHPLEVQDDFLRALLWGSLWDSVREAELAPSEYIELVIRYIPQERDEVTAQGVLARVQTAFNRYLSSAQQRDVAPRLEQMIADRMMNAETTGLRITYFRAFQAIATTDAARETLKNILRGDLKIPGMQLRSRDRFDIITALLTRGDADAPALLDAQSRADTTDDGSRYAYAAAAARGDAATKRKYFQAYTTESKLPESWIEASVGPFNSIQQSEITLPYLEPALSQLPLLKRTRKIFFVNGWLAAFVGGQCSVQANSIVQNFLQRERLLDRDLRLKVLEVADGLERCMRIRAKYAR